MILSIIGAIPDIIKAVEQIWEWIKQIRDRKTRREMTTKLRKLVVSHLSEDKKSVLNAEACVSDLNMLETEVLDALEDEGRKLMTKVAARREFI